MAFSTLIWAWDTTVIGPGSQQPEAAEPAGRSSQAGPLPQAQREAETLLPGGPWVHVVGTH